MIRKHRTKLLLSGLGLFGLGLLISWFVGGRLVAAKPRVVGSPPTDLAAESIVLPSQSGSQIVGWHFSQVDPAGVIVLLHGYRESRLTMLPRARLFHDAGYAVVLIDFQAHGESPGAHISVGHQEQHDARAAVTFARKTYPEAKIGVLGASMGGAAALYASPLDIDALVIESVYSEIGLAIRNRVAEHLGPLAPFPAGLLLVQLKPRIGASPDDLRPIDHIATVGCPIFVISGAEDSHTPASETELLFAAAAEPKQLWLVPQVGHVDLRKTATVDYDQRVLAFWDTHLAANF